MSSPFSFSPPPTSASPSVPLPSSLLALLSTPELSPSPHLPALLHLLLTHLVQRSLSSELKSLHSSLLEEALPRSVGLKGDWMARYVPDAQGQGENVEEEEGMVPTVISDVDGTEEMVKRVDGVVDAEIGARMDSAEKVLRESVERREEMRVEVLLGELLLEAREMTEKDAEVERIVTGGVVERCLEEGVKIKGVVGGLGEH